MGSIPLNYTRLRVFCQGFLLALGIPTTGAGKATFLIDEQVATVRALPG